ncbi:MAG: hypothetical protein Q8K75_04400 [Chlamydiales bacterium]|nr:hypothetical protein [Chlamydiales bacterium]
MKIFLVITTAIQLFSTHCFAVARPQCCRPNFDQAASLIINRSASKIENRYHIKCIGTGASMPGGPIRFITLSFQIRGGLSKEHLRKILLSSAQDILETAQEVPYLDACLYEPPFGIQSLDVVLFVYDRDGGNIYDPWITVANLSQGILQYKVKEQGSNFLKIKEGLTETYEEALKAIEEENGTICNAP